MENRHIILHVDDKHDPLEVTDKVTGAVAANVLSIKPASPPGETPKRWLIEFIEVERDLAGQAV